MIELYECEDAECDAILAFDRLQKTPVYCRWHHKRAKQDGPARLEPVKEVSHVSGRIGICFYCGMEENLTRDHVIPKSEGKQFKRAWNTVWCCEFCNRKKANMQLAEWLRLLDTYVASHGWDGVHAKYRAVLLRSRGFVTHLLTDPSHSQMKSYRIRIDPWWGDDPRATVRSL